MVFDFDANDVLTIKINNFYVTFLMYFKNNLFETIVKELKILVFLFFYVNLERQNKVKKTTKSGNNK